MARVPNHPPALDELAKAVGGKAVTVRFTGTRTEAQALLDEIDAKVDAAAPRKAT